jgi:hypothetical protein
MIIQAIVPLICCVVFGLLYLLTGNKTPTSPTTSKLVTLFMWFCVMAFLVVMLAFSHDVFRIVK